MSSYAWVKLRNFEIPLNFRIKYLLAKVLTRGRIKPEYKHHGDALYIRVDFEGDHLDVVISHFRELIDEWSRQNNIQP